MAHIIIADDDPLVPQIFGKAFREAGHSTGWVDDGDQVLNVLRARHVDALVLDCNMPRQSGFEVLWQIRASQFARLPVIMLTGRTSNGDRDLAHNARVDLFCTKSSDPDWLVYQVEVLIADKSKVVNGGPANPWINTRGPIHHC
ncbi:response regulator [Novosphingobium sp.]|uniref:response regulator n=1 Tax=Novosphingobium sp. TaxID=1874826 RepID=UPI0025D8E5A9|nr:response regulator [Novosphingobium sp.]